MPPKKRISHDQIVDKAFEIVVNDGKEALNARLLAASLGCSTQPIFSSFSSMEELIVAVKDRAIKLYESYISKGLTDPKPFLGSGLAYIGFAKDYPNLFKLLYMDQTNQSFDDVNIDSKDEQMRIAQVIMKSTSLEIDDAKMLHLMCWVYVHGIASMIATKSISFTDEIITQLIVTFYQGALIGLKKGKDNNECN